MAPDGGDGAMPDPLSRSPARGWQGRDALRESDLNHFALEGGATVPYDLIISRTDAGPLIPPEQVNQVIKAAEQESLALGLMRQVNMGTKLSSVPVLSAAPTPTS